jgi:F0F1-type ATP synthase assembly protein I
MTGNSWSKSVSTTIGLQAGGVLIGSALVGALGGRDSALSFLVGGASVTVPNAILGAYLWLKSGRAGALSAATFLVGEMIKLAGTVTVLYLAVRVLGTTTVWLALVAGILVALKGQWLAVWYTRDM